MSSAEIGGDSSVEWDVKVDHVKGTPRSNGNGQGGWNQHGLDDTEFGKEAGFDICLRMPDTQERRDTFVDTLCEACAVAQAHRTVARHPIRFTLPIEPQFPDQIKIDWKSKPVPPGRRIVTTKAAVRKGGPAPSRKKTGKRSPKKARKPVAKKARRKRGR